MNQNKKVINSIKTFAYSADNNQLAEATACKVGYGNGTHNRMYLRVDCSSLPRGAKITKATLILSQTENAALSGFQGMGVYEIPCDIQNGITPPQHNAKMWDYIGAVPQQEETNATYSLDVTPLCHTLTRENSVVCLVLKVPEESAASQGFVELYGNADSSAAPYLEVEYIPNFHISMNQATHTHSVGRLGTVGIDLQKGNLLVEAEDFSFAGNRMPVTLQHLYTNVLAGEPFTNNPDIGLQTADFSPMKLGNGWRLNGMQSMVPTTLFHNEETVNGYLFMDERGCQTTFVLSEKTEDKRTDEQGNEYFLFVSTQEEGLTYDALKKELYQGDTTFTFDANGRLVEMKDSYGNQQTVEYENGQMVSVTDGAGRTFAFTYENGFLTKVTAPDGTALSYGYAGENLTQITYPDGRKACLDYNGEGDLVSIELKDTENVLVYATQYEYDANGRVVSVKEFGYENQRSQLGQHTTFEYSAAMGFTKVNTPEQEEDQSATLTTTTVYTFNEEGDVAGSYIYTQETGNLQGENQNASTIHPYAGEGGAGIVSNINNLLKNHSFHTLAHWQEEAANSEDFHVHIYSVEANAKYGRYMLNLVSRDDAVTENGVYQQTEELPAGDYTFSVYLRPDATLNQNDCAFLRVTDLNGNLLAESDRLCKADSRYHRVILPFTLAQSTAVRVHILMNGKFTMYADGAQLENNTTANPYNMLENGNFELGNSGWDFENAPYGSVTNQTCFNMEHALQLQGNLQENRSISQILHVKSQRSSKETFTLSGWAKASSLPLGEKQDGRTPSFCLKAIIHYKDGEQQVETAAFSPCTDQWQLASVTFEKERYAIVSKLEIVCEYNQNYGNAYFDDIQLVRDSWETNLTADDFGSGLETEEEQEAEETAIQSQEETNGFEEVMDAFGNALTETTFTDGEFGTLYRSFAFDASGNDLVKEVDTRGGETHYVVDENTSRNQEVIDRMGNKTAYEYDVNGRTTKVTNQNANGEEIANVSYAYDAFDNLTEIVRGDGMKYALGYNTFHNLESIGVDGKDTPLVQYAYKNGNGRLKQMTYANGHRMEATYNGLGQMTCETWYNEWDMLSAKYRYVYDGAGNIVQTLDIKSGKAYNYEYEKGVLAAAKEYNATFTDGVVTAKTLVASIGYHYDDNGQLLKKVMNWNNPDGVPREYTLSYEYPENGEPVVTFGAGLPDVIFHSKSDTFGRKEFEELQLRKGFSSRQFVYHSGEVTQTHKENAKLKSSPTTGLIKEIVFSDGSTVSYEYDAEERITKVTQVYTLKEPEVTDEGVSFHERWVTDVTEYTYDCLGQLLTETKNGQLINQMTYDAYGNIRSKNGKTYSYGDSKWKDLLTQVDGKWIDYDDQGNPIIYLDTNSLYWGKGRELLTFIKCDEDYMEECRCDYTYNANGIRTSKTVNNVRHDYLLEGTKILRETWHNKTLIPLYDNADQVCGISYNGRLYSFLKNLQGDVIALVDDQGDTVARYSYDAWGVPTVLEDHTDIQITRINPFLYRTYYYDHEIGMYYLQSRYYDPTIGRFLNSDDSIFLGATENIASYNLFAYCENNSVMNSDPTGKIPLWVKIAIGIVGITAAVVATVATGGAALPALIGVLKVVVGSMAINMAVSGLIGWITGGAAGLKRGLLDGAVNGFMWGGIFAAVAAVANIIYTIRAAKAGKLLRYTKHGSIQALGRDGGKGVSEAAIRYTIKNPTKTTAQSQYRMKFESKQAVVVLNKFGQIITTWAKSRKYWR